MRKRLVITALIFSVLGVFAATGVSLAQYPSPSPSPAAVPAPKPSNVAITGSSISDYAFAPRTAHVKKGGKVKWTWSSNAPHNITFKTLSKHSQTATAGSFSARFKTSGTYHYFCSIHGFTGKVVVVRK